jgi:hypothetical protein
MAGLFPGGRPGLNSTPVWIGRCSRSKDGHWAGEQQGVKLAGITRETPILRAGWDHDKDGADRSPRNAIELVGVGLFPLKEAREGLVAVQKMNPGITVAEVSARWAMRRNSTPTLPRRRSQR